MDVRIANSPVSWGVDVDLTRADLPPWRTVLAEIAAAGYRHAELGCVGYLPEDPATLRRALREYGLQTPGTYVLAPVHQPDRADEVVRLSRRTCELIANAGGRWLVIVDWGSPRRAAVAGRSDAAPRQSPADRDAYFGRLRAMADLATRDFGLTAVIHPHAGTWLEYEDEIEALLRETSLQLCMDTGHFAYAGIDPVAFLRRHAPRIPYLNLKDLNPGVHSQAMREGLGFMQAVARGIFSPLGKGCVDFPELGRALEATGYSGFATVEQDRDPTRSGSAIREAAVSLAYLRSVGIADTDARALGNPDTGERASTLS